MTRAVIRGLAGGLLGYISHPRLWLIASPGRFLALLHATFSQESGGNPDALNPERKTSVGLAQFQPDTWNSIAPTSWATASSAATDNDPRRDPLKSGYVAALYVSAALADGWRWYRIRLPWRWGLGQMRALWTRGISASPSLDEGVQQTETEGQAWPAYIRAIAIWIGLLALAGLIMAALQRRGRGGRR